MSQRPWVIYCGGRSRRTGKPVGERHRWPDGWGRGRCEFCNRTLDEVLDRTKGPGAPKPITLDQALKGK